MRYRKVTLMPTQGLVLEGAAKLWHCWSQQPWMRGYCMYVFCDKIFFSSWVSKLDLLLSTLLWHVLCLPDHLMAFCGCSTWIQFYEYTSGAAEFWGVETKQTMGLIRLHHGEIVNRSSEGRPLIQVWGNFIFPSWWKEQRKMWRGEKETAVACLMESCWW